MAEGGMRVFLRAHRAEIALFLVAVALYLPGIAWGLPDADDAFQIRSWATDAITPIAPLAELHNTLIVRVPHENVWYPLFHYMVLAVVFAPYLLLLLLTGGLSAPSPAYPYGLADPATALQVLEILGRLVSMVMAAGAVVAAFATGRVLWGRRAGFAAAVFVMLMQPVVYYARTGNVDMPVLFWGSLGILVFATVLRDGFTMRRAAWLGVFAALATATKDQGWGLFLLLPFALLVVLVREARDAGERPDWRIPAVGVLSCAGTYLVASGWVLNPTRWVAHLEWLRARIPFPEQTSLPATPAGYGRLLLDVLGDVARAGGPVVLVLGAIGVVLAARRRGAGLAVGLAALGHFLAVIAPVRMSLVRYVIPIAYVACLFAGYAVARGLESGKVAQRAAVTGAGLAVLWGVVLATDLTYQMWFDSRYAAARWLAPRVSADTTVGGVISASSLPPLGGGWHYIHLSGFGAATDSVIQATRPDLIIVMPDWTRPAGVHPRDFPAPTYQALASGTAGYRLAERFRTPPLVHAPLLDYPTVNPPIDVFVRAPDSHEQ